MILGSPSDCGWYYVATTEKLINVYNYNFIRFTVINYKINYAIYRIETVDNVEYCIKNYKLRFI